MPRGFNFEKMDRHIAEDRDKKALQAGYEKAHALLIKEQLDLNDFRDRVGVEDDMAYVQKMEALYESEDSRSEEIRQLSEIVEAIIFEQTELSDWLGENTSTIKTSRFDDIKNGVDSVLEIETPTSMSHIALGIDVTFSIDTHKKFKRIKDEIETGRLANVKYFNSEHQKGELKSIPRVVIGVSKGTVEQLNNLWLNNKKKELGQHWLQFQIIEELIVQLEAFKRYAISLNKPELALKYDRALNLIGLIKEDKAGKFKDPGTRDQVFEEIRREAENLARLS